MSGTVTQPRKDLAASINGLVGAMAEHLGQLEWAEDEIRAARERHPRSGDLLWHALALTVPTHALMRVERNYRAHCRELLERVAAGTDTRSATDVEVALACAGASGIAPLNVAATTLYMRVLARAYPGSGTFDNLSRVAYEHVAGDAVDELERLSRSRLARPDRRLDPTKITCSGRHHGETVACRFYQQPWNPRRGNEP